MATLAILAAGMGSRYGGLKQVDVVGNNGESIIDFTIYDAIEAGFDKLVLIIRREHKELFDQNLVKRVSKKIKVEYAFQDMNDIPKGVVIPEGRQKPWGTSHALLACREVINEPFIICNADDYYGKDSFRKMYAFLRDEVGVNRYAIAGYKIANTLSDNGTVTRGICQEKDGYLTAIKETANIRRGSDGTPEYEENGQWIAVNPNTPVSMNFWGFDPSVFVKVKEIFDKEIFEGVQDNPLKYEALLPSYMDSMVKQGTKIKVLTSEDSWFGVTYKEDKESVVNKFTEYKARGLYPFDLWN